MRLKSEWWIRFFHDLDMYGLFRRRNVTDLQIKTFDKMLLVNAWVIVMSVAILIYRLQKGQACYTFHKNDTLQWGFFNLYRYRLRYCFMHVI